MAIDGVLGAGGAALPVALQAPAGGRHPFGWGSAPRSLPRLLLAAGAAAAPAA